MVKMAGFRLNQTLKIHENLESKIIQKLLEPEVAMTFGSLLIYQLLDNL